MKEKSCKLACTERIRKRVRHCQVEKIIIYCSLNGSAESYLRLFSTSIKKKEAKLKDNSQKLKLLYFPK